MLNIQISVINQNIFNFIGYFFIFILVFISILTSSLEMYYQITSIFFVFIFAFYQFYVNFIFYNKINSLFIIKDSFLLSSSDGEKFLIKIRNFIILDKVVIIYFDIRNNIFLDKILFIFPTDNFHYLKMKLSILKFKGKND